MRATLRLVLQFTLPAVVLSAIAVVSYLSVPTWHTRTIQRWIRTHSLRIAGLDPSLNVDDLEPLGAHLQGVQIVALGEQSHGTHEFFLLKHRLFKYLVTRLGFRAVVLEASRARCRPINDYVLHRKGYLGNVVHRQGFFTWDTREMADLIQWIHDYNRSVPDTQKVQFFGMDPQLPEIDAIEAYVKSAGTRDAEFALKSLALVDTEIQDNPFLTQLTAERGVDLQMASTNVETFLDRHREELLHRGVGQFNIIREDAHQLTEAIEAARDPRLFFEKRDTYMAESVRDLLSQLGPRSRIVIWAHNYHVSSVRARHSVLPMGELLRRWYGPAYFAVGFSFGTGAIRAKSSQDLKTPAIVMTTHPPDQGSIDDYLARRRMCQWLRLPLSTGSPPGGRQGTASRTGMAEVYSIDAHHRRCLRPSASKSCGYVPSRLNRKFRLSRVCTTEFSFTSFVAIAISLRSAPDLCLDHGGLGSNPLA